MQVIRNAEGMYSYDIQLHIKVKVNSIKCGQIKERISTDCRSRNQMSVLVNCLASSIQVCLFKIHQGFIIFSPGTPSV